MSEKYDEIPAVVHLVQVTVEYGKWHTRDQHSFGLPIKNPVDIDEVITKRDNMIEEINKNFWNIYSITVEYK